MNLISFGETALMPSKTTAVEQSRVIALAGNPNVGKSTVFNQLTGMRQHVGNWAGKTVANARGQYTYEDKDYCLIDLPGTYSLMAHSAEEEVARDFICFGKANAVVVVCDATCLERNMNLVLQTLEITDKVVLCVNLMDEAKKKGIKINFGKLSKSLGIPVVGISARGNEGMNELCDAVERVTDGRIHYNVLKPRYPLFMEKALSNIIPVMEELHMNGLSKRWVAIKLLCADKQLTDAIEDKCGINSTNSPLLFKKLYESLELLKNDGITQEKLCDITAASMVLQAEEICADTVTFSRTECHSRDRKIDKILIGRFTGIPVMLILLTLIFWLTITGANIPSQMLADIFAAWQEGIRGILVNIGAPIWLQGALVDGILRVLLWVVAVMLPPMAIFFPLFTLLEDAGYLPRVAFNLDRGFQLCNACGKQALTTCMGFGCNAVGVTGCRIIDSPRERLIAILTNSFVPCNGRFPPFTVW